jgi:cytochrome c-type biogenesis protein CcmE
LGLLCCNYLRFNVDCQAGNFIFERISVNTRKLTKVIIAAVVIGAAAAYLLRQTTESSWAYYYSVDEFVQNVSTATMKGGGRAASKIDENRIIRLAGTVKDGSVVHNVEKMQLDFELAGKNNSVAVRFYGAVPKNFEAGKEVVVEGRASRAGIFEADKILTRCESKYKAKLDQKLSDK